MIEIKPQRRRTWQQRSAGGLGGAFSIIVLWILRTGAPDLEIPAEVSAAITTVICVLTSWLIPEPPIPQVTPMDGPRRA